MNPADITVSRLARRRARAGGAGFNRTGAQTSPLALRSMQSYADEQAALPLPADGAARGIAAVRLAHAREAGEVGSVPMPGAITAAFTVVAAHLEGDAPELLVDKLGERLAWARSSVRLYQALMDKMAALAATAPAQPLQAAELRPLRDEALEHMHIAASALDSLGADSSALTPSAAISALVTNGVMQVLTDPRTTLHQCLEAILTVELADESSWELLMRLAETAGQEELLRHFHRAFRHDHAHVQKLKHWRDLLVLGAPGH